MDDYDTALACAEQAFARRICGMSPRESADRYVGPFDFMAVVNSIPLPRSNTPNAHRKSWAVFRQKFSEDWGNQGSF